MYKYTLILLVCGLFREALPAQEIQLNEPPQVAGLMSSWVNHNRANPRIEGWRVQIMSSTDRVQIEEGRTRFRTIYPEIPAEWIHEKPYYKLRAGAFRTKQEALAFITNLIEFPGAYPAKDANIHPRDFLE